ncbi:MAG: ECF-type sigma factor, partial [Fuerstiella sp.]
AGLSEEEAAEVLNISRATASRWRTFAKAWLYQRIQGAD